MSHEANKTTNTTSAIAGVAAITFGALILMTPVKGVFAEDAQPPNESFDGLVRVPDSEVAWAYVDPEADFSVFERVLILDVFVAFRKNWQRDQRRSGGQRVSAGDMERIKRDVARLFKEAFTERLEADDGFEVVDTADYDVLLLRPAIIDLDITAPDTMTTGGRSQTFASSVGAATLYLELYDSVSGDILARAADRRGARRMGGSLSLTTRVTNVAEARRIFRQWADLLRQRLDEFHREGS